jgi:hypothetical protein
MVVNAGGQRVVNAAPAQANPKTEDWAEVTRVQVIGVALATGWKHVRAFS